MSDTEKVELFVVQWLDDYWHTWMTHCGQPAITDRQRAEKKRSEMRGDDGVCDTRLVRIIGEVVE